MVSPRLEELLGSYEEGVVPSVTLQGEIRWQEVNQIGLGPALLDKRSSDFPVTITRSLGDQAAADFTS